MLCRWTRAQINLNLALMDIAHDSITANDAPPTPAEPPLIKREDYTPFAWLLPKTGLVFDLDIKKTRVEATLHVERNPAAERSDVLRLNGDGIEWNKKAAIEFD